MPDLRETGEYQRLLLARQALAGMDHRPEIDPDELIPRYFESGVALDMLSYVEAWDLPDDVRDGLEVLTRWLRPEHAGHERLLVEGRLPRSSRAPRARAYIANVVGDDGFPVLDEPVPADGPGVPYGDDGVVVLYGDVEAATVRVVAMDENDAERRIIRTFGLDVGFGATIDDMDEEAP